MQNAPRYVLSERAATALRALIAPGSGYGSRQRRILSVASFAAGMQWRITTAAAPAPEPAEGEEPQPPSVAVSVGAGIVAWGAGVNYANPGSDPLGTIAAGESARVVWRTTAAPLPLVHDPRWPTGNAPECADPDCDCPSREGDPDGEGGDAGELLLVPPDWIAPDGTTDCREIGLVEVSASGVATVTQIQRDTIVARAIVGRNPGGENPDEKTPNCGNPLNDDDDYNPLDHTSSGAWSGGGGGVGVDRNPLDDPGAGGYTPTCRDNIVNTTAA